MSKDVFQFMLFSHRNIGSSSCAEKVYEIFDSSSFRPDRYDRFEPIRRSWGDKSEFSLMWQQSAKAFFGMMMMQRRKPPSFWSSVTFEFGPNRKADNKPPYHEISVRNVAEKHCVGETRSQFISLCDNLFTSLEMDYGFLCLDSEYDKKNIVRNVVHPDGAIEPEHVIGMKWPYCLPGLYWTNYFGENYLSQGMPHTVENSGVACIKSVGKGIRVQLGDDPRGFETSEGVVLESSIRRSLGESWFFDPHDQERECRPLDVSLDELRSPS